MDVLSEVNGTVWEIIASPGQTLAEGDEIMILESMKMEIMVLAPRAGRLTEIAVSAKEAVEEGRLLARMEA